MRVFLGLVVFAVGCDRLAADPPGIGPMDNVLADGAGVPGDRPDAGDPLADGSTPVVNSSGVCSADQWCWNYPSPVGNAMRTLVQLPSKELLAIGEAETFLSRGANGWAGSTGDSAVHINDAWADGQGTVWLVGKYGYLAKRVGTTLTVEAKLTQQSLTAIHGTSASDIWAMGDYGDALHFDGTSWTKSSVGQNLGFAALYAVSKNDVWAAGSNVILHFDGSKWNLVRFNERGEFRNFAFTSINAIDGEIWLTSDRHSVDSVWKLNPATNQVDPFLGVQPWGAYNLAGTGKNDLWVLGENSLHHFDGTSWTQLAATAGATLFAPPGFAVGQFAFTRLVAFAKNDVWLLGPRGKLAHYDGTAWKLELGHDVGLSAWDFVHASTVVTRGAETWVLGGTGIYRFDGTAWTFTAHGASRRTAAAIVLGTEIYRIDRDYNAIEVLKHDGTSWQSLWRSDFFSTDAKLDIWGSGPQDLYVAADALYHSNGGAFQKVTLSGNPKIAHVHGTSAAHVWAAGNGVAVYRFDGNTWDYVSHGLGADVYSLYTDAPNHGWIGADKIYEFSGATLKTYAIPPGEYGSSAVSSFTTAKGVLYAGGGGYTANILRFSGTTFIEERTGIGAFVTSMTTDAQGRLWALSAAGLTTKAP